MFSRPAGNIFRVMAIFLATLVGQQSNAEDVCEGFFQLPKAGLRPIQHVHVGVDCMKQKVREYEEAIELLEADRKRLIEDFDAAVSRKLDALVKAEAKKPEYPNVFIIPVNDAICPLLLDRKAKLTVLVKDTANQPLFQQGLVFQYGPAIYKKEHWTVCVRGVAALSKDSFDYDPKPSMKRPLPDYLKPDPFDPGILKIEKFWPPYSKE